MSVKTIGLLSTKSQLVMSLVHSPFFLHIPISSRLRETRFLQTLGSTQTLSCHYAYRYLNSNPPNPKPFLKHRHLAHAHDRPLLVRPLVLQTSQPGNVFISTKSVITTTNKSQQPFAHRYSYIMRRLRSHSLPLCFYH